MSEELGFTPRTDRPKVVITDFDYGDVKVFGVEFDDPNAPQTIGSHSILPGDPYATKTTLIFFNGGEQVDVYQGQSDMMMAAILSVDI